MVMNDYKLTINSRDQNVISVQEEMEMANADLQHVVEDAGRWRMRTQAR